MIRDTERLKTGDHVVIVGGGPAGLTMAYLLAKQGFAVTVLEASGMVGGLSRTARYKGYRFDIGGHRFFTKISPVHALWEELLGDEFIDVPRLSRIHYRGRYFNYPLKAMNALVGLGAINSLRVVASYLHAKMYPSPVEDTFAQWVTNRFGKRLYEIFFRTYTEKVWGLPCTEIRAEWAAQRIQGFSLARAILTSTSLTRRSHDIKSLIERFRYPRLGPGQMWEACRDRILALGGSVLLHHPVSAIELEDGRASAVIADTAAGAVRIPADHVVSSMDIRSLMHALHEDAPSDARAAGDALRYRDFLVVALILNRDALFPDNWIYVHSPGVQVGRIQNFNNWSADMVPEAGRTCLGMEYFCFEGDGLWESTDADLIALAARELSTLGLAQATDVVDGTVLRVRKAYPVYDAAYRTHLDTVRAFIDPIPNLHTVGRNGMHKYNNQDHSMFTAMLTLENMLGVGNHDVWNVNTDFEYIETQRVPPSADTASEAWVA